MTAFRLQALVWLALLMLLGLTVASSYVFTGLAGAAIGMTIALSKAGLIFWYFMHLRGEGGLVRLTAVGAVVWMLLLLALTASDYLTRNGA